MCCDHYYDAWMCMALFGLMVCSATWLCLTTGLLVLMCWFDVLCFHDIYCLLLLLYAMLSHCLWLQACEWVVMPCLVGYDHVGIMVIHGIVLLDSDKCMLCLWKFVRMHCNGHCEWFAMFNMLGTWMHNGWFVFLNCMVCHD